MSSSEPMTRTMRYSANPQSSRSTNEGDRMIGLEGPSAQALSNTIGTIYDCALDPQCRFDAIRRIDDLCDSKARGICVHDLRHVQNTVLFEVGYSKEFSESRRNVVPPFTASVALCVQEPAEVPLMPGEAFARLYGLTGGELRLLLALAHGLGGKEAADLLGIGEPTIRTHLQRIFAKTGTSRQGELLQLLQSAAPPIRAA